MLLSPWSLLCLPATLSAREAEISLLLFFKFCSLLLLFYLLLAKHIAIPNKTLLIMGTIAIGQVVLSQLCLASFANMSLHMTGKQPSRWPLAGSNLHHCLGIPTTERNVFAFTSCMSASGRTLGPWGRHVHPCGHRYTSHACHLCLTQGEGRFP